MGQRHGLASGSSQVGSDFTNLTTNMSLRPLGTSEPQHANLDGRGSGLGGRTSRNISSHEIGGWWHQEGNVGKAGHIPNLRKSDTRSEYASKFQDITEANLNEDE